jgi:hypothetical protein
LARPLFQSWVRPQNLAEPIYCLVSGCIHLIRGIVGPSRVILHRRPNAAIFYVSPELLEAERGVWTDEEIHASVVLGILDACEYDPGSIQPLRQGFAAGIVCVGLFFARRRPSLG